MRDRTKSLLVVVGFFLVTLIVLVLIPFLRHAELQEEFEANRYNGFDFWQRPEGNISLWVTRIQVGPQPYEIPFYYHPRETESVLIEDRIGQFLLERRPKLLYFTFSPDAGSRPIIAGVELSRITGDRFQLLSIPTRSALQEPVVANSTIAVVTCANATGDVMVLQFNEGPQNRIYRDDNPFCIRLEYVNASESIRVADRLAYRLVQIMS